MQKSTLSDKVGLKGLQGNVLKGIVNPYVGIASFDAGKCKPN
jgi:hypothetical protein